MVYEIIRSTEVDRDLLLIFRHLIDSYNALGEPLQDAFQRATQRIGTIGADMRALGQTPHQGTQLFDLRPGLRQVTKNRAIFYFIVNDDSRTVHIVAVFFGGQDHRRHMLKRFKRS